jgi:CheY-like chemotaxis protein
MDGIETARRISSAHDLPIIFLTAQGDALTKRRMLTVQPQGILSKPFTPAQLADVVHAILPNGGAL